jgi:uncharacterized membrane protein YebE (DUF533 family)
MSLMGTLAKVAIGYAAARGIDRMSAGQGLPGMFGGATVPGDAASAAPAPGADALQAMMGQFGSGLGNMQQMMAEMAEKSGLDLGKLTSAIQPQSGGSDKGLLASVPGGGTGIAGMLAAFGGLAQMTGKNMGDVFDKMGPVATTEQGEEISGLLLRAMLMAVKADGHIDPEEQARIMDTVGADADAEDIAFVQSVLKEAPDPEGLARATPPGMQMQVYSMSLMSIRVDTEAEAQYLDRLAKALDLNQQQVNALHLQMGVKPLYS